MPSLKSAVHLGSPKQFITGVKNQVTTNIRGEFNQQVKAIGSQVRGEVQGIQKAISGSISGTANAATAAVGKSISNAVSQAFSGNFSGAVGSLASAPANALSGATAALKGSPLGKLFGLGDKDKLALTTTTDDLGNTLRGIQGRPDALLSFQWYCMPPPILSSEGINFKLPWSYVEGAQLPFRQFETTSIRKNGKPVKYLSGDYSVDDLNLTIFADMGVEAIGYILAYQSAQMQAYTPQEEPIYAGGFNTPSEYKRNITFYLVSSDRSVIFTVAYTGFFIKNVSAIQLESGNTTRLAYSLTCSVDDVYFTVGAVDPFTPKKAIVPEKYSKANEQAAMDYKPAETVPVNAASAIPSMNFTVSST